MPSNLTSQIVNLCSGQIQFADPTKPWSPNDFPTMPSTNLVITATGTADNANISTLSFTNNIIYEPYEPSSIYVALQKSLVVDQSGVVLYKEPVVGFVSTIAPAFTVGCTEPVDVRSFAPSSIGGAGILDVLSGTPDTITNALGKLDAWIANAFLYQPPAIQPIEPETTSLYGGMRWLTFDTYSVLDKSVPYVTNILFIIGDPTGSDYCTFEVNDCAYFPYKTYCDGISPVCSPLVRLRIFTKCFLEQADELYSKQVMQTHCIKLITEAGNVAFPDTGKVLAIENTNGVDTYTTLSVFFPNLTNAYPDGTPIPVYIAYMNKTDSAINVIQTSTIVSAYGSPGEPQQATIIDATSSAITYELQRPIYSDISGSATVPLFDDYQVSYTLEQMATSYDATTGFRYGLPSPSSITGDIAIYNNSTFTQTIPYIQSTQTSVLTGLTGAPLVSGAVWSTSVAITNCAGFTGAALSEPLVSTLFPTQSTPAISSITVTPFTGLSGGLVAANLSTLTYPSYTSGWSIGPYVSTDVLFLNVSTPLIYIMSTPVQFNDSTLPGDRSTITLDLLYTNADNNLLTTAKLTLSTFNDDFPLNTIIESPQTDTAAFITQITDSQTVPSAQKYFYNCVVEAEQIISTISTATQTVQIAIQNTKLDAGMLVSQTLSSQAYSFQTDKDSPFSTKDIVFSGQITSTGQVSGLYTPTADSQLCFDIVGTNFANAFTASTFGYAQFGYIEQGTSNVVYAGPKNSYTADVHIYSASGEVTTLPFPQNVDLTMSSVCVSLNSTVYTSPISTPTLFLEAAFVAASPLQTQSTFVSTLDNAIFVDTVSMNRLSQFISTTGPYGQRVRNLLPRLEDPGTVDNMNDGMNVTGDSQQGLNVSLSSFFKMSYPNIFTVSTAVLYNNTSTISTIYTDTNSRELLFTDGHYVHPGGLNFSQFSGQAIGEPSAVYPDFTNDLVNDVNYGYRYASFAFETSTFTTPTPFQFINVRIINPSHVGNVGFVSTANTFFPCAPVDPYVVPYMNVRLHAKYYGAYNVGMYSSMESEWINGLKECDQVMFNDQTFDIGGCYFASTIGNDIVYSIQMNRRFYTKLGYVIRLGISGQGSYRDAGNNAITFDGIQCYLTDDISQTQTDITATIY